MEGLLLGDAQAVHHAFQRQPLPFPARVALQKQPLQVVPAVRPVFVQAAQEQVLLQHGYVVKSPFDQLGVLPCPVHKALQPLADGQTGVQVALRKPGHLGNMVLQLAEDAGLQRCLKGVQHVAALVDARRADLDDLAPQGQLGAVVQKGFGLVADIPFQVKNDQVHRSVLLA